jgi:hypothetical protein
MGGSTEVKKITMLLLVLLAGCDGVRPSDVEKAIAACKDHGGYRQIYQSEVVCYDNVTIDWTYQSKKYDP